MIEKKFLQGFLGALFSLGLVALALQVLMTKVGEIGLVGVIDRQLAAQDGAVLFSSAINQHAYNYKMVLLDRIKPRVVAIGSSRAMQVRGRFFKESFTNLGGATNNIAELELVANHLAVEQPPRLQLLFLDPWWFNERFPGNTSSAHIPEFPKIISADLILAAIRAIRQGNWIAASLKSANLGIYALLINEGFSKDGSFDYIGTTSGEHRSSDEHFSDLLKRIADNRDRMEKSTRPDPLFVRRMCHILSTLKKSAAHLIVITPPFSSVVWQRMMGGGYEYIAQTHADLRTCSPGTDFFDFSDPARIPGSTDCEFIDGIHGGDVIYARILRQIALQDPELKKYLDDEFTDRFVHEYSGIAGGMPLLLNQHIREVDFLKLGCKKS
jgi:hypothetical protein